MRDAAGVQTVLPAGSSISAVSAGDGGEIEVMHEPGSKVADDAKIESVDGYMKWLYKKAW